MFWFLRGLRRGVVTTRYPAGRLDQWTTTLPTPPAFHTALLSEQLAAELQDVCPARALRHEPGVLVVDLGACSCCGRCERIGGAAVVASGEFLLAARERTDLVKRIPIGGTDER